MELIVVFDQLNSRELSELRGKTASGAEILNLSDIADRTISSSLPFLDRTELLLKHQPKTVELFNDLIGAIGEKTISQGKNVKQLLAAPAGISMWWFNAMQYKFYREYQLCNWLVYAHMIKELIGSGRYEKCLVCGGPAALLQAVKEQVDDPRLGFYRRPHDERGSELLSAMRSLARTLYYAFNIYCQTLLVRLFYRPAVKLSSRPDITFLSIYPGSLVKSDNKLKDRYYGPLPGELQARGLSFNYLAFLDNKQGFKGLFDLNSLRAAAAADHNITLLESKIGLGDIARSLLAYLAITVRIFRLPAAAKRSLFTIDGRDYSALFLGPFLNSVYDYQILQALLLIGAAGKYARQHQPRILFTCYDINHVGRAVIGGFRKYGNNIPLIGLQHASFPATKLETRYHRHEIDSRTGGKDLVKYVPFIDYELFQGQHTMDLFLAAGLPAERALLLGSPRFDALFKVVNDRRTGERKDLPTDKVILLVATGLYEHDLNQLLSVLFAAVDERFFLVFKPHPNKPIEALLESYGRSFPGRNYRIASGNIYELLPQADILIATHSTVAEEAIVLGKPAISVHASPRLNIGALACLGLDVCAYSVDGLKAQIEKQLVRDPAAFAAMRERVIEQLFGVLDGKATERVADYVLKTLRETSNEKEMAK